METSRHASCAKLIRADLKVAFPGIKFSVRSDSYSGGSSVNVNWTDGPTDDKVQKVISKYQYGHFDGMADIYEFSNVDRNIPQVQYVCTQREMSQETRDMIIKNHNSTYVEEARIEDLNAYNKHMDCWNSTVVYRHFRDMDIKVTP